MDKYYIMLDDYCKHLIHNGLVYTFHFFPLLSKLSSFRSSCPHHAAAPCHPLITQNVWKNKKSSGGQKTCVKRICRVCMMCRMSLHYKEPFRFTPPCYFRNAIKFVGTWFVLFTVQNNQPQQSVGEKSERQWRRRRYVQLPPPLPQFPTRPCHFVLSCSCAVTLFRSTVWLNDPKHFNIVFGGSLAASSSLPSNGLPCHAAVRKRCFPKCTNQYRARPV